MNDLVVALLETCEFWVVLVSGFVALVVYIILCNMGFPAVGAIICAIFVFLGVLVFLLPIIC